MEILKQYQNNVSRYIEENEDSIISYGSEFRPVAILDNLFMHHRSWPTLRCILTKGSKWPLEPITKGDRVKKNNEFISRGNHKSANTYLNILKGTLEKEVSQGWMIPIPLHYINKIPEAELAPVGIDDKQFKILQDGSKLTKYR